MFTVPLPMSPPMEPGRMTYGRSFGDGAVPKVSPYSIHDGCYSREIVGKEPIPCRSSQLRRNSVLSHVSRQSITIVVLCHRGLCGGFSGPSSYLISRNREYREQRLPELSVASQLSLQLQDLFRCCYRQLRRARVRVVRPLRD